MVLLKTKVGKSKPQYERFKTFSDAYKQMKNYYDNYGSNKGQRLGKKKCKDCV